MEAVSEAKDDKEVPVKLVAPKKKLKKVIEESNEEVIVIKVVKVIKGKLTEKKEVLEGGSLKPYCCHMG